MKKTFLLLLCCLLFSNLLSAQTQYKWTHYSCCDGLAHAYEGDFFWTSQVLGLSRQNLKTGEVKAFRPNVIQADSVSNFVILDMVVAPNGIKWLTTSWGLIRFDDVRNTWQYIKYPNQTYRVYADNIRADKNGNIWSLEEPLYYPDERNFANLHCYSPQENRWIKSLKVDAGSFEIDSNNVFWLANRRRIRKLDINSNTITIVADNDTLKNGSLLCIDRQNNIWFGGRQNTGFTIDSSFLYRYDGRNLTRFRMPISAYSSQNIHGRMGIDSLNRVHIIADSSIYRFDGTQWSLVVNRNFPTAYRKDFFYFDSKGRPIYGTVLDARRNLYVTDSFVRVRAANSFGVLNFEFYEDKNGNKWFFGNSSEYTKMIDSTTFKYYTWPFRLGGPPSGAFQDSAKNFWRFRQRTYRDTLPALLIKFDGVRFDSFALPSFGNLYASSCEFIGNNLTNRIIATLSFAEPGQMDSKSQIMEFKNNVWSRFDTLNLANGNNLSIDSKQNIWFQKGTNDIFIMDKQGSIKTLQSTSPPFTNIPLSPSDNTNTNGRFHDKKGNTWVIRADSSWIYKYDGVSWQAIITTLDTFKILRIGAATVDEDGNLWLTAQLRFNLPIRFYTYGLLKFDGRNWTRWLSNETEFLGAKKIYVDKDKLVWLDAGDAASLSMFKENGIERRVNTVDLNNRLAESIIFPNPMTEEATIILKGENTEGVLSDGILSVFDLNGRLICQKIFEENKVILRRNELPQSGLYIYQVAKGGKFSVGKISVQ